MVKPPEPPKPQTWWTQPMTREQFDAIAAERAQITGAITVNYDKRKEPR